MFHLLCWLLRFCRIGSSTGYNSWYLYVGSSKNLCELYLLVNGNMKHILIFYACNLQCLPSWIFIFSFRFKHIIHPHIVIWYCSDKWRPDIAAPIILVLSYWSIALRNMVWRFIWLVFIFILIGSICLKEQNVVRRKCL